MARSRVAARTVVAVDVQDVRHGSPPDLLERILAAAGMPAVGMVVAGESSLSAAVAEAAGGRLVVAGGDATVHAAVNAAAGSLELGIVPVGRTNHMARALGIPRDLPRAARMAVEEDAHPVDVLRVETPERDVHAIQGLSAGLEARARTRRSSLAVALRDYEPFHVELELDGELVHEGAAAEVFLSNLKPSPYGFDADLVTNPCDGRFEAVLLKAESGPQLARLVLAAYRGGLARRAGVMMRTVSEALITSPLPMTCDGQALGTTIAAVRIEKDRLTVARRTRGRGPG